MLPANGFLDEDFVMAEQSSHTFYLDIDGNVVFGFTDQAEAMKQAIYLTLETERYQYVVFSWDYGVEFVDLFGKQMSFVLPELKRKITEALLHDTRVLRVDDFDFQVNRNVVLVTFTAVTVYGNIPVERAVII